MLPPTNGRTGDHQEKLHGVILEIDSLDVSRCVYINSKESKFFQEHAAENSQFLRHSPFHLSIQTEKCFRVSHLNVRLTLEPLPEDEFQRLAERLQLWMVVLHRVRVCAESQDEPCV